MNPVGQTIHFWRMKKGLTQAVVAERSGVSRPNLSAIEQGGRDLTVQTLRRIASTLGVTPGALVDGVSSEPRSDRAFLDRIARLAAGQFFKASPAERRFAQDFASIMKSKTGNPSQKKTTNQTRAENTVVWRLKTELGPTVFDHLIRRIEKNLSNLYE